MQDFDLNNTDETVIVKMERLFSEKNHIFPLNFHIYRKFMLRYAWNFDSHASRICPVCVTLISGQFEKGLFQSKTVLFLCNCILIFVDIRITSNNRKTSVNVVALVNRF